MHHRLLRRDRGLRHPLGLYALVVALLGDGLVVHELLPAREIGLGESEIGARLSEIGAHLFERDRNGRRSMVKRRSPFLTICPSVKWISERYPERRARTSTASTATKRPTYSSWSTTVRSLRVRYGYGRRRRWSRLLLLALTAAGQGRKRGSDQQGGGQARRINDGHEVSFGLPCVRTISDSLLSTSLVARS